MNILLPLEGVPLTERGKKDWLERIDWTSWMGQDTVHGCFGQFHLVICFCSFPGFISTSFWQDKLLHVSPSLFFPDEQEAFRCFRQDIGDTMVKYSSLFCLRPLMVGFVLIPAQCVTFAVLNLLITDNIAILNLLITYVSMQYWIFWSQTLLIVCNTESSDRKQLCSTESSDHRLFSPFLFSHNRHAWDSTLSVQGQKTHLHYWNGHPCNHHHDLWLGSQHHDI